MRLLQAVALSGVFYAYVKAQDKLTIATPTDVVQCKTVVISWQGGEAPYALEIYDSEEPLGVVGITENLSYLWIADVDPSFNPLRIVIQSNDPDRQTVATNPFNVTAAPENCTPTSGSSTSASTLSSASTSASSSASTAPSPTSPAAASHHNSPVGIIVGIVVAVVVVLLLLGFCIWWFCRRRSARKANAFPGQGSPTPGISEQKEYAQPQLAPMQPLLANYGSAAPGQAIYMTPEGSSVQEGSISTASAPAPLPRSEKGRRRQADAEQAQQAASSSFATARVVQPAQRREEDAGVRVDVPVEDDLDDSMTLPPAYNDIRHSSGGPAISLDRLVLQPIPSRQE